MPDRTAASVAETPGLPPVAAESKKLHGFYERALNNAERPDFAQALEIEGLDNEIALVRLRLKEFQTRRPEDLALFGRGVDVLARLVVRRYRLPAAAVEDLAAAMRAGVAAAGIEITELP
jgi:hypothetical protein